MVYPSDCNVFRIVGKAAGVFLAPLWNNTMDPGFTFLVTRSIICCGVGFFQSNESTSDIKIKICSRAILTGFIAPIKRCLGN